MIPALIIAAFVAVVGIILYIFELRWRRRHPEASASSESASKKEDTAKDGLPAGGGDSEEDASVETSPSEESQECCGLHLVCEKDSLSPMSAEIEYYDDEELDRFIGRTPDSYTPEEEEEFREVLMTLRPEDVSGWARSITQRHLELPADVRDALLMLVREQRDASRRN